MTDTHRVLAQVNTVQPQSIMHPLVAKMLEKDPTPEALEKILKLQSDWEAAEAKRAYTSALVELKKALPPFIIRDQTVDYTSAKGRTHYTHASLAGAMEIITPILSDYGFSMTWKPGNTDKGLVKVTAKLSHRQGYSEEATLESTADTSGNKNGPQSVASSVTLLARYACLGMLGLATKDMVEPAGETAPDSDAIDTSRNMRAMADLIKGGKKREDIEAYVGRAVKDWTAADLDKLRAWIQPPPAPEATITSADSVTLKKIMDEFKLNPVRMLAIVSAELGREIKGSQEIKASELPTILKAFADVREARAELKGDRIEHPPA